MKNLLLRLFFAIIITVTITKSNAQTSSNVEKVNDVLSANSKDVLYNYIQLAAQNIFGNSKSFDLNTTLFELKRKYNPDINLEQNFIKEKFSRNFAFNVKINFDSIYKLNGFTGGFTYAFLNKRDKNAISFVSNSYYANKYEKLLSSANEVQKEIETVVAQYLVANIENKVETDKLNAALDYYHRTQKIDSFPNDLKEKFNKHNITEKYMSFKEESKKAYAEINNDWLGTIAFNISTNTKNKVDRGSVELIFLKGNNPEFDWRTKLSYYDTALQNVGQRAVLHSKLGANFPLLTSTKENVTASVLEFKIAAEYTNILKNALPGENDNSFMASGELRVKITKEIWLPLSIKYSPNNGNFFGFLNVTFNQDVFSSKK